MSKQTVDVTKLIEYIAGAQCKIPLAAERLNKDFGTTYTSSEVLAAVSSNAGDLTDQLRTQLLISMFDTQMQIQLMLVSTMHELKAPDIARLYTAHATAFANLASKPVQVTDDVPLDNVTAKSLFIDKLEEYSGRKVLAANEEEATGTDGPQSINSRHTKDS